MWEIWCIGDLNYFVSVLNGVAMLFNSGFFEDMVKLGLLLGILFSSIYISYEQANNFQDQNIVASVAPWLSRVIVIYAAFHFMFGTSTTVLVQDTYSLESQQVDNVPTGIAVAGSLLSKIGHEITVKIEEAFSTPSLTENGFASALEPLKKKNGPQLIRTFKGLHNGDIYKTLKNYIADCSIVCLSTGQINEELIKTGSYTWQEIKCPSEIYTTQVFLPGHYAEVVSCTAAWNLIDGYFSGNLWNDWEQSLHAIYCTTENCNPIAEVQNALDTLVETSRNAREYMLDIVMIPAIEEGQIQAFSDIGKPEMSIVLGQGRAQRNFDWTAQGSLFLSTVRPMMAFFEGLIYAVSPFMALMLALPAGFSLIGKLFQMLLWIQFWMPTMAILNHFVQFIAQRKLSAFDLNLPITSVYGIMHSFSAVDDWLAVAGYLTTAVPIISYAIITGGAYAITSVANKLSNQGDYINEKIARPDVAQPAPAFQAGAMLQEMPMQKQYAQTRLATAAEISTAIPTISVGDDISASISSSYNAMQSASHEFAKNLVSGLSHNQGFQNFLSHQYGSATNITASQRESAALAWTYAHKLQHALGLSQNTTEAIAGKMLANLEGGASVGKTKKDILSILKNSSQNQNKNENVIKKTELNAGLKGNIQVSSESKTAQEQKFNQLWTSDFGGLGNESFEQALVTTESANVTDIKNSKITEGWSNEKKKSLTESAKKVLSASKQYSESMNLQKNISGKTSQRADVWGAKTLENSDVKISDMMEVARSSLAPKDYEKIGKLANELYKKGEVTNQDHAWVTAAYTVLNDKAAQGDVKAREGLLTFVSWAMKHNAPDINTNQLQSVSQNQELVNGVMELGDKVQNEVKANQGISNADKLNVKDYSNKEKQFKENNNIREPRSSKEIIEKANAKLDKLKNNIHNWDREERKIQAKQGIKQVANKMRASSKIEEVTASSVSALEGAWTAVDLGINTVVKGVEALGETTVSNLKRGWKAMLDTWKKTKDFSKSISAGVKEAGSDFKKNFNNTLKHILTDGYQETFGEFKDYALARGFTEKQAELYAATKMDIIGRFAEAAGLEEKWDGLLGQLDTYRNAVITEAENKLAGTGKDVADVIAEGARRDNATAIGAVAQYNSLINPIPGSDAARIRENWQQDGVKPGLPGQGNIDPKKDVYEYPLSSQREMPDVKVAATELSPGMLAGKDMKPAEMSDGANRIYDQLKGMEKSTHQPEPQQKVEPSSLRGQTETKPVETSKPEPRPEQPQDKMTPGMATVAGTASGMASTRHEPTHQPEPQQKVEPSSLRGQGLDKPIEASRPEPAQSQDVQASTAMDNPSPGITEPKWYENPNPKPKSISPQEMALQEKLLNPQKSASSAPPKKLGPDA